MEDKRNRYLLLRMSILLSLLVFLASYNIQNYWIVKAKSYEKEVHDIWFEDQTINDTEVSKRIKALFENLKNNVEEIVKEINKSDQIYDNKSKFNQDKNILLSEASANKEIKFYLKKNKDIDPITVDLESIDIVNNTQTKDSIILKPFLVFAKELKKLLDFSNTDVKSFESYSDHVLSRFFSVSSPGIDNLRTIVPYKFFLPDLKVFRIYCAEEDGAIGMFPNHHNRVYSKLISFKRDWWAAAWGRKNPETGKNESYPSSFKEKNSGLSAVYTDIEENKTGSDKKFIFHVRTYWYKFEFKNRKFVIGIDLFLDKVKEGQSGNMGLLLKYPSILSSIISILFGFLFFYFTSKTFKQRFNNFINNFFPSSMSKVEWQIKARRIEPQLITDVDGSSVEKKFIINGTSANNNLKLNLKNWSLQKNTEVITYKEGSKKSQDFKVEYTAEATYPFSILKPLDYCEIEVWEIFKKLDQGMGDEELGFFEIRWAQIPFDSNDVLEIKNILWEGDEDENMTKRIVNQLQKHLLKSGKGEINISMDYEDLNEFDNIPEPLNSLSFIKGAIDSSKDLLRRKYDFSNIENYKDIYDLGKEVQTICSKHFLESLTNQSSGKLAKYLELKVSERYFIENRKNEFKKIYERFGDVDQEALRKAEFQIKPYSPNSNNIINEKHDFAIIIPDGGKKKFIVFNFMNDAMNDEGVISWNPVYTDYLDALFKKQIKGIGGPFKSVQNYLDNL